VQSDTQTYINPDRETENKDYLAQRQPIHLLRMSHVADFEKQKVVSFADVCRCFVSTL